MAIKEKIFSYLRFSPKGRKPDGDFDEYGLEKLKEHSGVNIYHNMSPKDLIDRLSAMERGFRVYQYRSIHRVPFTLSFNRGYTVEHYFLKTIRKTIFATKRPDRADAFIVPATPYMYYTLVQLYWKLLQLVGLREKRGKDTADDFQRKREMEEDWLRAALKVPLTSDTFNHGINHVYFSSKLGTEFLQKVNEDLFENGILVVNSADAKRGRFDKQKDVSSVCSRDFKGPKYAHDIKAFDLPYEKRKHYAYYAGMIYGQRRWVHELRTDECLWILHHVSFRTYLDGYAQSKYYFHFPGSSEWSPRLFEGMYFGAVPVIVYDQYTLPFSDFIDWSKFAVLIHLDQIRDTYQILSEISEDEWNEKRKYLRVALKHFCYHKKPVFGDAFYMTMFSIQNRLK